MATEDFEKAKKNKADDFYTQLPDIEEELHHYKDQFFGKVVFCNCDDPYESNFFKYFATNFNHLGLKKLVTTCYAGSPVAGKQLSLFDVSSLKIKSIREKSPNGKHAYKIEITEVSDANADGAVDLSDVKNLLKNIKNALTILNGDGDFRSPECIKLLKDADIVVTNPPFSLFREYVASLIESSKQFLIIGSQNAVTYKEVFKYMQENKLWLGYDNGGTKWFQVPMDYDIKTESRIKIDNNVKYFSMGNIAWFTNLDVAKRHENIELFKRYTPEEYPRYVNYDAIEVSKVADIPYNYSGEMGVPITFLDKYNPEQFEIIGSSWNLGKRMTEYAAKGTYETGGIRFYLSNGDGTYRRLYDRIVIKRKGAVNEN